MDELAEKELDDSKQKSKGKEEKKEKGKKGSKKDDKEVKAHRCWFIEPLHCS